MSRLFRSSVHITFFIVFFCVALPAYALVNINTANLETLDTLPGVGPTTAQYIVEGRPYASVQEISKVKGIGEPGSKTYEDIIDLITVSSGSEEVSEEQSETDEEVTQHTAIASTGVFIDDTLSISVDAGADRTVFVGADSLFEAHVVGAQGKPVEGTRVVWSFGNGDRKEGQKVLYHFMYPGTYTVVADAANDVYGATDRVTVTAIPAHLTITEVTTDYIAIKNNTDVEVDVGGWLLFSLGNQFQFPPHTIFASQQEVLISNKRTGLSGSVPSTVALQYPNGLVATSYEYPLFVSRAETPASNQEAPLFSTAPAEPSEEHLTNANVITSPIVASEPFSGLWLWILGVIAFAGLGGAGMVFARKNQYNQYDVEEL